jgi:hypothetical protein
LVAQRTPGGELPRRLPLGDFLVMLLATQKLSRLITKDRGDELLRNPFAR